MLATNSTSELTCHDLRIYTVQCLCIESRYELHKLAPLVDDHSPTSQLRAAEPLPKRWLSIILIFRM